MVPVPDSIIEEMIEEGSLGVKNNELVKGERVVKSFNTVSPSYSRNGRTYTGNIGVGMFQMLKQASVANLQ